MAANDLLELHPTMPDLEKLDLEVVTLSYDDLTDTLFVHFFGEVLPAVSVEVADGTFLRVRPETQLVVGLQIESALSRRAIESPEIINLAELAGAPPERIAIAGKQVTAAVNKRAALASLFGGPLLSKAGN